MKNKEYGDFQTPMALAELMIGILRGKKIIPEVIVEPTCGLGSILFAAHKAFAPQKSLGIEIQTDYTNKIISQAHKNIEILNNDFFTSIPDIKNFIGSDESVLFIGNPPWVTNSELSSLASNNLPLKSNFDKIRGIEAITGKSNFDISEYIIKQLIEEFSHKKAIYAFLCKISVAKKIMQRLWKNDFMYGSAEIYPIDSKKYFSAAVDACFFYLDCSVKNINSKMTVFTSIENPQKKYESGFYKNIYLEDISKKETLDIYGKSPFIWRNGVKHDCSKVMELKVKNEALQNGYGETVDIENNLIFPYLKSSDLAKQNLVFNKKILVTQKYINEPTDYIRDSYPKTWEYLNSHNFDFEKRKSIIYKNKYAYSIFSVGDYTFKPYKIAISGLYKSLNFKLLKPFETKTVLLDDTCNFISFETETEADFILQLLQSEIVSEYLNSRISWESKRPIKTEILNSIDLEKVSEKLHLQAEYYHLFNSLPTKELLFA